LIHLWYKLILYLQVRNGLSWIPGVTAPFQLGWIIVVYTPVACFAAVTEHYTQGTCEGTTLKREKCCVGIDMPLLQIVGMECSNMVCKGVKLRRFQRLKWFITKYLQCRFRRGMFPDELVWQDCVSRICSSSSKRAMVKKKRCSCTVAWFASWNVNKPSQK